LRKLPSLKKDFPSSGKSLVEDLAKNYFFMKGILNSSLMIPNLKA